MENKLIRFYQNRLHGLGKKLSSVRDAKRYKGRENGGYSHYYDSPYPCAFAWELGGHGGVRKNQKPSLVGQMAGQVSSTAFTLYTTMAVRALRLRAQSTTL